MLTLFNVLTGSFCWSDQQVFLLSSSFSRVPLNLAAGVQVYRRADMKSHKRVNDSSSPPSEYDRCDVSVSTWLSVHHALTEAAKRGPVWTAGLPQRLSNLSHVSLWLRTVLCSAFDYTWTDLCRSSSTSPQLQKFYFDPTPSMTSADPSRFSLMSSFPFLFFHASFSCFLCFIFIWCLPMCLILSFLIFMLRSNRPASPLHFFSLIKCEDLQLFTGFFLPLVAARHNWCIFSIIVFKASLLFLLL